MFIDSSSINTKKGATFYCNSLIFSSRGSGNLELALPETRASHQEGGKPTAIYNYLSQRSAGIIEQKVNVMMRAELHDLMDENKHIYGIDYLNTAYYFLRKYSIEHLSPDALLKDYQRWKAKIRRQRKNHM